MPNLKEKIIEDVIAAPKKKRRKKSVKKTKTVKKPSIVAESIEVTDEMIAEAAYYKALSRGFLPGFEQSDWYEAKAELVSQGSI